MMIPDKHEPIDADAALALLKIGEIAKSLAGQLDMMELVWTEASAEIKKLPTTVSTLSLRTRLSQVDERLSAASSVLHSICDSCRVSSELFPLPEERLPDDREPSS
jgi:hypothetical protein